MFADFEAIMKLVLDATNGKRTSFLDERKPIGWVLAELSEVESLLNTCYKHSCGEFCVNLFEKTLKILEEKLREFLRKNKKLYD